MSERNQECKNLIDEEGGGEEPEVGRPGEEQLEREERPGQGGDQGECFHTPSN